MSEEQPSYKVTDRRLFNPDGSPREVPPEEQPEPKPTTAELPDPVEIASQPEVTGSTNTASAAVAAEAQPQSTSQAERNDEKDLLGEEAELPGADDPASFASFMMSIASNAASSLGMMEQKTRGNLLPQEQQILEGLLADLRMQYVSLTRSAAAKAPRTYTGRDI